MIRECFIYWLYCEVLLLPDWGGGFFIADFYEEFLIPQKFSVMAILDKSIDIQYQYGSFEKYRYPKISTTKISIL